jgi:hypothetical protein
MKPDHSAYIIKKEGALYRVFLKSNPTLVQYSSLKRINCKDWVERMEGKHPQYEEEPAEA